MKKAMIDVVMNFLFMELTVKVISFERVSSSSLISPVVFEIIEAQ